MKAPKLSLLAVGLASMSLGCHEISCHGETPPVIDMLMPVERLEPLTEADGQRIIGIVKKLDAFWQAVRPDEPPSIPSLELLEADETFKCNKDILKGQNPDVANYCSSSQTIVYSQAAMTELHVDGRAAEQPVTESVTDTMVLAHEYGHFIDRQTDRTPGLVGVYRRELTADCLAGQFIGTEMPEYAKYGDDFFRAITRESEIRDVSGKVITTFDFMHGTSEERTEAFYFGALDGDCMTRFGQ